MTPSDWLFAITYTSPLWIMAILIVGKCIEHHCRPTIERDDKP